MKNLKLKKYLQNLNDQNNFVNQLLINSQQLLNIKSLPPKTQMKSKSVFKVT